jgi:hypothetical protein
LERGSSRNGICASLRVQSRNCSFACSPKSARGLESLARFPISISLRRSSSVACSTSTWDAFVDALSDNDVRHGPQRMASHSLQEGLQLQRFLPADRRTIFGSSSAHQSGSCEINEPQIFNDRYYPSLETSSSDCDPTPAALRN